MPLSNSEIHRLVLLFYAAPLSCQHPLRINLHSTMGLVLSGSSPSGLCSVRIRWRTTLMDHSTICVCVGTIRLRNSERKAFGGGLIPHWLRPIDTPRGLFPVQRPVKSRWRLWRQHCSHGSSELRLRSRFFSSLPLAVFIVPSTTTKDSIDRCPGIGNLLCAIAAPEDFHLAPRPSHFSTTKNPHAHP